MDYRRERHADEWSGVAGRESYILREGYFHLSAAGWQRMDLEPFPQSRLETWRYTSYYMLNGDKELRHLRCVWANRAVSRNDRDRLRRQIGWPDVLDLKSRTHTAGKPL